MDRLKYVGSEKRKQKNYNEKGNVVFFHIVRILDEKKLIFIIISIKRKKEKLPIDIYFSLV